MRPAQARKAGRNPPARKEHKDKSLCSFSFAIFALQSVRVVPFREVFYHGWQVWRGCWQFRRQRAEFSSVKSVPLYQQIAHFRQDFAAKAEEPRMDKDGRGWDLSV
jgi:hypothetical protein